MRSFNLLKPRFLRPFDKVFKNLSHENQRRIKNTVDEILDDPKHNSKFGSGQWRGKRERREGHLRIMYSHCEECRQDKHDIKFNMCPNCDTMSDDTATFYAIIDDHKF
jgi:mRNA-degrading endonuclease RelE of RelBE toxin-antitoxin system